MTSEQAARVKIARLMQKEALLFPLSDAPILENEPWREKVIHWFFSVVAALERTQQAGVKHPFNRAAVHVTTALLDNHLSILPIDRSSRFRRDRIAYQVLATSCLLLGMRLVHHHQSNEYAAQQGDQEETQGEMRRTINYHEHMDQQANHATNQCIIEIPNASAILRISAAPKCISEEQVLAMVREITSSRIFPRSQAVTALDFIQVFAALSSPSGVASSPHGVLLGPSQERHANALADAGLFFGSFRPSIVACAAITIAMLRRFTNEHDITSIRRLVLCSIFGENHDDDARHAVRELECRLVRATVLPPRNNHHVATCPSAHIIPHEE
eukprot:CCRYP_017816-RA/>CCRYP_017816-RA protein AED:0.00 eAED:0.00 QI:580/-1/1/1/-1/1/1/530/328